METLAIATTPHTPFSRPGKLIYEISNLLNVFTNHWFSRRAQKTNDALIEFSGEIMLIKVNVTSIETKLKCSQTLLDNVCKHDHKSLTKILRIGGDDEQKRAMISARQTIINNWTELKDIIIKLFASSKTRAQFLDSGKTGEPGMDGSPERGESEKELPEEVERVGTK